jgi:hypothetical protein
MARFLAQAILILVVFIAAWRAGGKPERCIATVYLTMFVVAAFDAILLPSSRDNPYDGLYGFRFILDLSALFAVITIALRYDRWWTLWVGSAQFVAVMAHLLRLLDIPVPPLAYAVMERWPVWIAVLLTGLGTTFHHRRRKTKATAT